MKLMPRLLEHKKQFYNDRYLSPLRLQFKFGEPINKQVKIYAFIQSL